MKCFFKYLLISFVSFFHLNTAFTQSIYDGGNGDGFSIDCYSQVDNPAFDIYAGGSSDGFSIDCYTQLDNPAFDIYAGGNSDGFSIDCYTQLDNPAFDIYTGGNSDGFSIDCYTQLDNPAFDIYAGGSGDGNALFCVGTDQEVPLPIELINFNAVLVNHQVLLNWQTTTEINNDFFTIERSKKAVKWEEVVIVNGAGNSNQLLHYKTIDEQPYFNISYYRLKQTDFDGNYTYSDIKAININLLKSEIILYPNPTTGQITIKAGLEELKDFKIYNVLGQDITNLVKIISEKETMIILDLKYLPQGIYTIKTRTTANKVYKSQVNN